MWVGIQDEKVVSIKETKEELKNIPCVEFDEIKETTNKYILVNGEYRLNGNKTEDEVREERDILLNNILWRVDRYNQQKQLGIETIDSEEEYLNILKYIQYLRDIPQQSEFPNIDILTYNDWKINNYNNE